MPTLLRYSYELQITWLYSLWINWPPLCHMAWFNFYPAARYWKFTQFSTETKLRWFATSISISFVNVAVTFQEECRMSSKMVSKSENGFETSSGNWIIKVLSHYNDILSHTIHHICHNILRYHLILWFLWDIIYFIT